MSYPHGFANIHLAHTFLHAHYLSISHLPRLRARDDEYDMIYPPHHDRSPEWAATRDAWIAGHPACAYCGRTAPTILNVHHILPFHIFPGEELNTGNLITLCEQEPYYCHLAIGHLGDWLAWSPVLLNPDTPAHAGYITFLQAQPLLSTLGGSTPVPQVSVLSPVDIAGGDGFRSILNLGAAFDIPSGLVTPGRVLLIDAYGSIADPTGAVPNAWFRLDINSNVLAEVTQSVTASRWHLSAQIVIRQVDVAGELGAGLQVAHDNDAGASFPVSTGPTTLDTTDTLHLDVFAKIDDATGSEGITCQALTIYVP